MNSTFSKENFRFIAGVRVNRTSYDDAVEKTFELVDSGGGFISIGAVHMIVHAYKDKEFRDIINKSAITTPDGVSLSLGLRLLGLRDVHRVSGPVLTPLILEKAAKLGVEVGFYGGDQKTLDLLVSKVGKDYPNIKISYSYSPPFRQPTEQEDSEQTGRILSSGTKILFVGIGCPKQERWINQHRDSLPIVMLGVGAAFNFIAGTVKRAPMWMQKCGLEWLYRFTQEPRRLWKRYLVGNSIFLYLLFKDFFKSKFKNQ